MVLKRIPGLPGLALDTAQLATADGLENRGRVIAEVVGGGLGAAAGAWAGPVGVAVGSTLGQKAGELIYDHRDEIRRGVGDMATWLKMREAEIAGDALTGLQSYARRSQVQEQF